jgi:hypothetical protein
MRSFDSIWPIWTPCSSAKIFTVASTACWLTTAISPQLSGVALHLIMHMRASSATDVRVDIAVRCIE